MTILIRVTPNASKNEIMGWKDDALKIKIAAPAIDGKANAELIRFLSQELACSKSAIDIVQGHQNKNKVLSLSQDSETKLRKLFPKSERLPI